MAQKGKAHSAACRRTKPTLTGIRSEWKNIDAHSRVQMGARTTHQSIAARTATAALHEHHA